MKGRSIVIFTCASGALGVALASGCSSSGKADGGGAAGTAGAAGSAGGGGEAGGTVEPAAGHPNNQDLDPPLRCPGAPDCAASEDSTLRVGAAAVKITPTVDHVVAFAPDDSIPPGQFRHFNVFTDKCVPLGACDHEDPAAYADCAAVAVDPMSCTWLAGFGIGRAATGVADDTWVRCAVVEQGNTKIGLCAVDNVGWFYNEVQRTRELLAQEAPNIDLDYFLVGSTHVHETQDTMGIWGPTDGESGVKRDYNTFIREQTVAALVQADAARKPATVQFGSSLVDGHIPETDPNGFETAAFVSDVRDPVVLDNEMRTIRFMDGDGSTITTLVNFTSHPEYADSENTLVTSDYPHTLRDGVENGLDVRDASGNVLYQADGVGGIAIFFNGALGGQVGPGAVRHVDFDGTELPEGIDRAYSAGRKLAAYALESLREGAVTLETVPIGVRAREIYVDVINQAFHIAIGQQLFDRDGEFYDPARQLGPNNLPAIRSQIAIVDIGPAEMITIPGELHAELLLATPEGVSALDAPYPYTPAPFHVLNDPSVPAPRGNPDCSTDGVSRCSVAPDIDAMDRNRIIDLARHPDATYRWALGLSPDQFGYLVPEYDFLVHEQNPYLDEPPSELGDHYEETNSVGPNGESQYVEPMLQLLRSEPVITR